MRRAALAATTLLLVAAGAGSALAGIWSHAGGDVGRSGFQPNARGTVPYTAMWEAADRDVRTSLVVTAPGADGRSPRVVYGTADGSLHVRDLFTGEPVGKPEGIKVSAHRNADVFSGLGGVVSPAESSGDHGLGQIYTVFNDRFGPTEPNPDEVTDEIAIAQVDASTGSFIQRKLLPDTEKYVISSSPLLVPGGPDGTHSLVFTIANTENFEADYAGESPASAPMLVRVPIADPNSRTADIQVDAAEMVEITRLTPTASPSVLVVDDESGDHETPNSRPVPHAVAATADPDAPLHAYKAHALFGDGEDTFDGLFTPGPPVSSRVDGEADPARLAYYLTPSVPVAPNGEAPGMGHSGAGRGPAVFVAEYHTTTKTTVVHKFALNPVGDALVEVGRSEPLPGKPAPQLATTQNGQAPGDSQGFVLLTTGRNLYALDGGDLVVAWKLDPSDALTPGNTGFGQTTAVATKDTVFVARDNGEQLALRLEDGSALPTAEFEQSPTNATPVASFGSPAITRSGVVLFGSDKGVFAYRARCANLVRASGPVRGTLAGDDVRSGGGADTIDAMPGDDCIESGGGDDVIDAGQGVDRVDGGAGIDRVLAGSDDDVVFGQGENDILDGQDGRDTVDGGFGRDVLKGGEGADLLLGRAERDRLYGESGADRLDGNGGHDTLYGGNGGDLLRGGSGRDRLHGGNGNDRLIPGRGGGVVVGGRGDDTILATNGNADRIHCGPGIDTVRADGRDRFDGCEYRLFGSRRVSLRRR